MSTTVDTSHQSAILTIDEAGAVAGSAVWISFLVAGTVATLQGFGRGHVSAITSSGRCRALIRVLETSSVEGDPPPGDSSLA